MIIAPPWALVGSALDAPTNPADPHLVKGVHLHVVPSPLIGLPATPLFVYRFGIHQPAQVAKHQEIRWTDSNGQELTPPFDVTDANPVTGYLPGAPVGTCIWVQVLFESNIIIEGYVAPPPLKIRMDARVSMQWNDPVVIASCSSAPYAVAAPRIDDIVLRGSGRVVGVKWLSLEELAKHKRSFWRAWSLPVTSGPRYSALSTAVADANARVAAGAPPHFPLYAKPVAGGPKDSPPATVADEKARVTRLAKTVAPRLTQLINDLSAPPSKLTEPLGSFDSGPPNARGSIFPLGHVLQSGLDPSIARWMGFSDIDNAPPQTSAGDLAVYVVRGLWLPDEGQDDPRLEQLAPALVQNGLSLFVTFPELLGRIGTLPSAGSKFYDLGVLLAAVIGAPQDRPEAPVLDSVDFVTYRGDDASFDVKSILRVHVHGLVFGSEIALVNIDSGIGWIRPLNPRLGDTRVLYNGEPGFDTALPLPIAASVSTLDPGPVGSGTFEDRDGGEGGGNTYLMAQADWFGRWSEWSQLQGGPADTHSAPYPPVLEPHYTQPNFDPGDTSALAGIFDICVNVPGTSNLPPGGGAVARLEIDVTIDGGPPLPTFSFELSDTPGKPPGSVVPNPLPTDTTSGLLTVTITGPGLEPAAGAHVSFVGRWFDGLGRVSNDGPVAGCDIHDPRALPVPTMPTSLIYAKRPDARGQARVELPLPSSGPAKFRIFYTTETTALGGLDLIAKGSDDKAAQALLALADINTAEGDSARAQAFGRWKQLLDWSMFENLTQSPFQPPKSASFFPHVLSGSQQGLALYRVLSVAPSGTLSDFATSPLVAAAVPNLGPPPQALVTASVDEHGVRLRVSVPLGPVTPVAFRVRRGTTAYSDTRQMRIVDSEQLTDTPPAGSWLAVPAATGAQSTSFELIDPGPFKPWRTYYWAVDVQANPPPGAPTDGSFVPQGEWSRPSALASLAMKPSDPPVSATSVVAVRSDSDDNVTVTITHPDGASLSNTPFGVFVIEVFRSTTNGRPRFVANASKTDDNTFTFTDVGAPADVFYTVRITDPLGRHSAPTSSSPVV